MSKSVGQIALDLVIQGNIKGQIDTVAKQMGKGLKNSLKNVSKQAFSGITNSMTVVIGGINKSINKMGASLKAALKRVMSRFTKAKQIFSNSKNSKKPQSKGETNDQKRGPPKDTGNGDNLKKTVQAGKEIEQVSSSKLPNGIQLIGDAFKNLGKPIKQAFGVVKGFFGALAKGISKISGVLMGCLKVVKNGVGMLWKQLLKMVDFGFISNIFKEEMGKMKDSLLSSIKANNQFQASLKQIRSNLTMAMMPIYQAIIPAVNALMSILSRVSGYIAAFTNSLFGKTLQGSAEVARGLEKATGQVKEYGSSAKKAGKDAQNSFGMDELNIIQKESGAEGGGGNSSEISSPDLGEASGKIDEFAEKVRNILLRIFEPIKASWDAVGINVMNSMKDALTNLIGLAGSIGKSFIEVWTNGSGEQFCINILRLVGLILNMVADVSAAFKSAWDDNGRGTVYIQSYFDNWNSILGLLLTVGESFRTVWNNGTGEAIIGNILEILSNINGAITNIALNFKSAWELDGTGTQIIQNIADIFLGLLESINRISEGLEKWTKDLDLSPITAAFQSLTDSLRPFGEKIGSGLEGLFQNVLQPIGKWALEQGVPGVLDAIAAALDTVNSVLDELKPIGEWLWNSLLKPLGEWTGGVIVSVLDGIANGFQWITQNEIAITILKSLALAIGGVTLAIGIFSIAGAICTGVVGGLGVAVGLLTSPVTLVILAIAALIAAGLLIVKNFDAISEFFHKKIEDIKKVFENVAGWFGEKFQAARDKVNEIFSGIGGWFSEKYNNIKTAIQGVPEFFKGKFTDAYTKTQETFSGLKGWAEEKYASVKEAFSLTNEFFGEKFKDAYSKTQEAFSKVGSWFGEKYTDVQGAFKEAPTWFQDTLGSAYNNIQSVIEPIGGFFSGKYTSVQDAFQATPEWFKNIFKLTYEKITSVFEPIKKFFSDIGDSLKTTFKGAINGVISLFNTFIGWINEKLNISFDGLTIAGQEIIPAFNIQLARLPKIPHLAQGGFVGANQPQLAMIGDNRHQGEVVAPENKLRQMALEAVQMAGKGGSDDSQYLMQMIALLKNIIDLVKNFDMVVNIDIRELHKKLGDLEKRMGYSFN